MWYGKVNFVKPSRNIKIRRKKSVLYFAYKTILPILMSIKDLQLEFVALKVDNVEKMSIYSGKITKNISLLMTRQAFV